MELKRDAYDSSLSNGALILKAQGMHCLCLLSLWLIDESDDLYYKIYYKKSLVKWFLCVKWLDCVLRLKI